MVGRQRICSAGLKAFSILTDEGDEAGHVMIPITAHNRTDDIGEAFMDPHVSGSWGLHWAKLAGNEDAITVDQRFRSTGGEAAAQPTASLHCVSHGPF